jgi:DNA polymerase-4
MDAFYASIEERENPDLRNRPLVVGGQASSRGVVAAANYAARKFGIYSAMPMASAVKKFPDLLIVKPRGELYSKVSKQIRDIFYRYTPVIEPLSLDEAFLDPDGSERLYGSAEQIGRRIKDDIKNDLQLIASVGIAPTKFVAKLASDYDKPDGFTIVNADEVQGFLDPMPVSRIWGVGKVGNAKLAKYRIRTVADLKTLSPEFLDSVFGQYGEQLWRLARGIDERRVTPDSEVKSVSQETTFDQDITYYSSIESTLMYLTEGVGFRLRESGLKGKTVTIKVRYDDFKTVTRSRSMDSRSNQTNELWHIAKLLLHNLLHNQSFAIRLVGVGVSGFGSEADLQSDLFDAQPESIQSQPNGQALDKLSDDIRHKFGKGSIKRGKSLGTKD